MKTNRGPISQDFIYSIYKADHGTWPSTMTAHLSMVGAKGTIVQITGAYWPGRNTVTDYWRSSLKKNSEQHYQAIVKIMEEVPALRFGYLRTCERTFAHDLSAYAVLHSTPAYAELLKILSDRYNLEVKGG